MAKRCRNCCTSCGSICVEAKSNCAPNPGIDGATVTLTYKGIASIARTAAGSGYTQTPTVVISGTNGNGGVAIALLTPTAVATGFGTATVAGSGYTSMPAVTFTPPSGQTGSGATGTCNLAVATAPVAAAGSGYHFNDILTVSGGTSTTAAVLQVTAVDGSGGITAVSVSTGGTYSVLPSNPASVTGGTGSGATFNLTWKLFNFTVTAGGSGYSAPPIVGFSGGGGSGAAGTVTLTATTLASVSVTVAGIYHTAPGITFSGGGGGASGAAATATLGSPTTVGTGTTIGQVTSVFLQNQGTGYTSTPTVTFGAPASGTTATGTVVMNTGGIASVSLTNGGSNYTTAPTATIGGSIHGTGTTLQAKLAAGPVASLAVVLPGNSYTPGTGYTISFDNTNTGGSGAAGTFDVDAGGAVTNPVLTAGGSNYFTAPTISFPGGSGATGTAGLTPGPVATLTRNTAGSGYQITDTPTVVFGGGGGGSGATATAALTTFTVNSVAMTDFGSGYTSTPAVTFSGGGGSGAAGTATVRHQACIPITTGGGYAFSASKTGWVTNSGTITLTTCATSLVPSVNLNPATATLTVTVTGCNGLPLPGATVTVKQSGTTVDSGTTNGSGVYTWASAAHAVAYTYELSGISSTFADPGAGSITINTCATNSRTINLSPATGCACLFADCPIPAPHTLNLADSVYGNFTLTFGSYTSIPFGTQFGWGISTTVNFPGCSGGCPAQVNVPTLYLLLANGTFEVIYAGDINAACCPIIDQANCQNAISHTGHVCPPSLLATWSVGAIPQRLYCSGGTLTVTQ